MRDVNNDVPLRYASVYQTRLISPVKLRLNISLGRRREGRQCSGENFSFSKCELKKQGIPKAIIITQFFLIRCCLGMHFQ